MAQLMYFQARDKANNYDLWVTDGTTTEAVGGLGDMGVANSGPGLGPETLTVLGQQMIFGGEDSYASAGSNGLWLSDGTAGGTTEIGGPADGATSPFIDGSPTGLTPSIQATFGAKALFFGNNGANDTDLWVTDGTKGGTEELGGNSNVGIVHKGANFSPENFATFNNYVLFDANDSSQTPYKGLWMTDGTATGTVEIGGLNNQGVADSGISNFIANDFITLGNEELFDAPNATGNDSLWITDGSALGTKEIGGYNNALIVNGDNTNLGNGLSQAVKFGNRIFFQGMDIDNTVGLWATDGTAAGTTEISGFAGKSLINFGQHPNPSGLAPRNFAVNGQQLLFDGDDAIGFKELWVSDGTALGTVEIGGEEGELPLEAANGLDPHSIVSLGNGLAVFIGNDSSNGQASGLSTLWVTNGTAIGTMEIGGMGANEGISGVTAGGLQPTNLIGGGNGIAYFIGVGVNNEQVLWETDGTTAGTKVVAATDGNGPDQANATPDPEIVPSNMTMGPVPAPPSAAAELPQDLTNVTYQNTLEAKYNAITETVRIVNTANNNALIASIALTGTALAGVLVKLATDGAGGTQVSLVKFPSLKVGQGDLLVSGIVGQSYIGYKTHHIGSLLTETDYYYQANGQGYQYYELDYTGGNVLIGQKYFYTNDLGQNYTSHELDYDGKGHLVGATYNGVTGQAYSSMQYTYNENIFTGVNLTYTTTPIGAKYSYFTSHFNSQYQYTGSSLFFTNVTGTNHTGEEVDINASNQITADILTGVTGSGIYDKVEFDYTGGVLSGSKYFADAITGQSYGAEEVDVNTSGQTTKIVFTGMTGSAITSYQVDYTYSGNTQSVYDSIYTFGNVTGQNYYQYSIKYSSTNTQMLYTVNYNNGSHLELGSTGFQAIYSQGNDTMTGGGAWDSFNLTEGFHHCEITDFYNHIYANSGYLNFSDLIVAPIADWASVSALVNSAQFSNGNAICTAKNGDTLQIDGVGNLATLTADSVHILVQ